MLKKPINKDYLFDDLIHYYNKMSLEDWRNIYTEKFWNKYVSLKDEKERKEYILYCVKKYFND